MTQIDFYTHVGNKLNVGCRLAAKAHAQGLRVAVLCAARCPGSNAKSGATASCGKSARGDFTCYGRASSLS